MSEIASFREVIALWDSREALAADIGKDSRLISKWWQRRKIPATSWAALVELPKAKEAGVTTDLLADLDARRAAAKRDRLEVA